MSSWPELLCFDRILVEELSVSFSIYMYIMRYIDFSGSLGINNVFQNSSALINYYNAVQNLTMNGIDEIKKMNFTKVKSSRQLQSTEDN
jgi:hypothetical protein